MSTEIVWLAPLLLLPGIAILIVSTSSRYSVLHDEIHHWLDHGHDDMLFEDAHLLTRAVRFRNALVSLYCAVFVFISASLIGAVLDFAGQPPDAVVIALETVGIGAVGFASLELIRESRLSLDVIRSHIAQIKAERSEDDSG